MDTQQKKWVNTSTCKKGCGIPELGSPEFSHCRCSHCAAVLTDTAHWTSVHKPAVKCQIQIGNRVVVKHKKSGMSGIVKYIGDLNSSYTNDQVYIGVKLDDPVGEHDGTFNGKRFFSCPDRHGIIVPMEAVRVLPNSNRRPSKHASLKKSTQISAKDKLDKSCVQNRIKSQLPSSRDGFINSSGPAKQKASVLPRDNENTDKEKSGVVEVVYNNEGDMFVDDAEGEDIKEMEEGYTFATKGGRSGENPKSEGTVKRSRSTGAIESFMSDAVTRERPQTSPDAVSVTSPPCTGKKVDENKFTLSQFSDLNGDAHNSSNEVLLPSVRGQPKYSANDVTASAETKQPGIAKSGTCDWEDELQLETAEKESMFYPPAPPTTVASTNGASYTQSAVDEQESLTSCLMSGLPLDEETPPQDVETEVEDLVEFERVMEEWGGDTRAWLMATTHRKLKNALRKGIREIQWQRKIRELEMSGYYPTEARRFRMMRTNIELNRRATAGLQTEIAVLRQKKQTQQAMLIATEGALKHEQEMTMKLYTKLMCLPSNDRTIRELQIMVHRLIHGEDIFEHVVPQ